MNGLQRTMLGTIMAGAATFGIGNTVAQNKTVMIPKRDTIYIDRPDLKTFYEIKSNPAHDFYSVQVNDTVYFNKKEPIKVKIPNLLDFVKKAQFSKSEFVENGLSLLRKIR